MKNKGILAAVFRGVVKSVPMGNVALQAIKNVKHEIDHKDAIEKPEKPHNWMSIVTQIVCILAIGYAFYTKMITIEQLLSYFGF
jgi:hypothetical protein